MWNKSYILGRIIWEETSSPVSCTAPGYPLLVAFVAAAVNMVIGILFGGISGYAGGMVDTVMMRIVDIISTIPLTRT